MILYLLNDIEASVINLPYVQALYRHQSSLQQRMQQRVLLETERPDGERVGTTF